MAKKTKNDESEAGSEDEAPKSKKKLIIMIAVFVLIGGFMAKSVLLKPKPPTPAQVEAAEKLAEAKLANLCASHNGLPTKPLPVEEPDKHDKSEKGKKDSKESKESATDEHEAGPAEAPAGPVDTLDAITINLAAGHYLKIGLALQIPVGMEPDLVKTEENWEAIALKTTIDSLSGRTLDDLTAHRQAEEHAIGDAVCRKTEGKVLTVYFTDFVMQ